MGFLLLGYLYVIAIYKDPTSTGQTFQFSAPFWILRVITAVMGIVLGKLWKDKGFWILIAYLLLKIIRVAIPNPDNLLDGAVSDILLTGLWVFCACYGLGRVLSETQLRQFLRACAAIWTVGMVIYASLGVYAAWTDQTVYNLSKGGLWGINVDRLFLVYYVTVSGSVLSLAVVIALCSAATSRHVWTKVLYILSVIPMLVALSLTDSRCAQVTVATGTATLVGILLLNAFRRKAIPGSQLPGRRPWYAWPVSIAVTGLVFVAIVLGVMKTISVFNSLKTAGGLLPRALAEETGEAAKTVMSNRGYTGSDLFTSRPMIWKAALTYISENPLLLLTGASILNPMAGVNAVPSLTFMAAHCHCMPLMIILENGIPGLLIVIAFLVLTAVRSFQLVNGNRPTAQKIFPALVISILAGELIECFTWLRSGTSPVLPFLFVFVGIIHSFSTVSRNTEL